MMECLTNEIYEKGLEVINEVRLQKESQAESITFSFIFVFVFLISSIYFKIFNDKNQR